MTGGNKGSEWVCWRRRGVEGQLWSERVGGQLWSGCVKEGEGLQLGGSCGVGVFRGRGVGG